MGQRRVDSFINGGRSFAGRGPIRPEERISMLSHGTAEAAANYVLAGSGAMLVTIVGGVLVLTRKGEDVQPAAKTA
jgi:hypothetical protein